MNWKKRTEWIDDAEKVRAARDPDETALDNARRQQGDTTGAVIEDGEVLFEVKIAHCGNVARHPILPITLSCVNYKHIARCA